MAIKSTKELINTLKFVNQMQSFDSRKHLFDFGIDSNFKLNENKTIARLKEEFTQNRTNLNIPLMAKQIKRDKFVANGDNDVKIIWIRFLQSLKEHKTIAEEEPTFVSLTETISNLFGVGVWDSTFYAIKFNGVIYLFGNQSIEMKAESKKEFSLLDYYDLGFEYLITDKNVHQINGNEKCLRVDRIDLKDNKLIVCSVVDANDCNGCPVYVKCRVIQKLDQNIKPNFLIDWSRCLISGIDKMIIGKCVPYLASQVKLEEVQVIDVHTIPDMCRKYWSDTECFSTVSHSLEFIKSCVGKELELYEFEIKSKDKLISCFRHHLAHNSKYFLPKFYTKPECDSI